MLNWFASAIRPMFMRILALKNIGLQCFGPRLILHGPLNIAGRAFDHASALRLIGMPALAYCMSQSYFEFKSDLVYFKPNSLASIARNILTLLLVLPRTKILHFYFGCTYFGYLGVDQFVFRLLGKKIVHHFCGCDIRDYLTESTLYPFGACAACGAAKCSPYRRRMIVNAQKYAHLVFVSTPDLLSSYPGAVYLPQAVSISRIQDDYAKCAVPSGRSNDSLIVAHAPTDRVIKGTDELVNAVDRLVSRGFDISLVLLEGLARSEVLSSLSQVDLVVDQLLIGSYGTFAVEAMALSIPVICYLRPASLRFYPEVPPVLNASIDTIEFVLEGICRDKSSLAAVGLTCREYAEKYHDAGSVAAKLVDLYSSI